MTIHDIPVWVVSTRKTGHVNQCLALLEAMDATPDRMILVPGASYADPRPKRLRVALASPFRNLGALIGNPSPHRSVILSSGRSSEWLCRHWRQKNGAEVFICHVGAATVATRFADLHVAAAHSAGNREHESMRRAGELIEIEGVPARRIDLPPPETDNAERPHPVALIGGRCYTYDYTGATFAASVANLARILGTKDCTADIVFSRRTEPQTIAQLRAALPAERYRFIDASDRTGYLRALASGTHFFVSADSVSMISECCGLGKPVYLLEVDIADADSSKINMVSHFVDMTYLARLDDFAWDRTTKPLPDQTQLAAAQLDTAITGWAAGLGGHVAGPAGQGAP